MSRRVCILPRDQATQLEHAGVVPRCGWHGHCTAAKANGYLNNGQARRISPARGCKHPKDAIALIVTKDYRPAVTGFTGGGLCGAPKMRTWQLTQ